MHRRDFIVGISSGAVCQLWDFPTAATANLDLDALEFQSLIAARDLEARRRGLRIYLEVSRRLNAMTTF